MPIAPPIKNHNASREGFVSHFNNTNTNKYTPVIYTKIRGLLRINSFTLSMCMYCNAKLPTVKLWIDM